MIFPSLIQQLEGQKTASNIVLPPFITGKNPASLKTHKCHYNSNPDFSRDSGIIKNLFNFNNRHSTVEKSRPETHPLGPINADLSSASQTAQLCKLRNINLINCIFNSVFA